MEVAVRSESARDESCVQVLVYNAGHRRFIGFLKCPGTRLSRREVELLSRSLCDHSRGGCDQCRGSELQCADAEMEAVIWEQLNTHWDAQEGPWGSVYCLWLFMGRLFRSALGRFCL